MQFSIAATILECGRIYIVKPNHMFIIVSSTPAQDSTRAIVQRIHGASKGAFALFFESQESTPMQGA